MTEPVYEELADDLYGLVSVARVNGDANRALAASFSIDGFPAIFMIRGSDRAVVPYRGACAWGGHRGGPAPPLRGCVVLCQVTDR